MMTWLIWLFVAMVYVGIGFGITATMPLKEAMAMVVPKHPGVDVKRSVAMAKIIMALIWPVRVGIIIGAKMGKR